MQQYNNITLSYASPYFTEVQQLAATRDLGTLQTSYIPQVNTTRPRIIAAIYFTLCTLGILGCGTALFFLLDQARNEDTYALSVIAVIVGLIFSFALLPRGFSTLRQLRVAMREQLHIFTNGFVYLTGQANSNYVWHWDDLENVQREPAMSKHEPDRATLLIETLDDAFSLDLNVANYQELHDRIERAYVTACMPRILELYAQGEHIEFTDVVVSQRGIGLYLDDEEDEEDEEETSMASPTVYGSFSFEQTSDDEEDEDEESTEDEDAYIEWLAWSDVGRIDITSETVTIHSLAASDWRTTNSTAPWFSCELDDFSNLCLFQALLAEVRP